MAETKINVNQVGYGESVFTNKNLIGGTDIEIVKQINPNVLDPETTLACFHLNGNTNNVMNNGVALANGVLNRISGYTSVDSYPWYTGMQAADIQYVHNTSDYTIYSPLFANNFTNIGTESDFTLEFRMFHPGTGCLAIFCGPNYTPATTYAIEVRSTGSNRFYITKPAISGDPAGGGEYFVSTPNWFHFAFVRHNGEFRCYVNGVEYEPVRSTRTIDITNFYTSYYGNRPNQSLRWTGLAELVLTKEAKWTSNFTVPTAPYDLAAELSTYEINSTLTAFTGTDGTAAGAAGLVPAPATTDADKFLKADGTWSEVGSGTNVLVDDETIVKNASDVISTVAVKDQNSGDAIKKWVGVKADYDLIDQKDPDTTYIVTDDDSGSADVAVDNETIIQNQDSTISTVGVKDQNSGDAIKTWVGTKAEFDLIDPKDPDTLYTVTNDVEPGGGSLTYTTFNNIFGNTLDVSSLGDVESVYKNGILLNRSSDTYTTYENTGTSAGTGYHWNTVDTINIQSLTNWQYRMLFTCGVSTDESGLIVKIGYFYLARSLNQELKVWLKDVNDTYILNAQSTGKYVPTGKLLELLLGFTGGKYYFNIRPVNVLKYETVGSLDWEYTTPIRANNGNIELTSIGESGWGNNITIYQQSIKFGTENAPLLFDGATAVLGTDYVVGADLDVSTAPIPNTYAVNNGTITFIDTVNLDDEIIVAAK